MKKKKKKTDDKIYVCNSENISSKLYHIENPKTRGQTLYAHYDLPRPDLDKSKARANCAYSGCGCGLFGHFSLVCDFSLLSPPLWETARYRL